VLTRRQHDCRCTFRSYSNDIDAHRADVFVGAAGAAKWASLVQTWVAAMRHPRYLTVGGRPVFKVLIPAVFVAECGGDVGLATARLAELRAAAAAAGLMEPIIGGGWANPAVPDAGPGGHAPRPHPGGYMLYNRTAVAVAGADIKTATNRTLLGCETLCNATATCVAFEITLGGGGGGGGGGGRNCTLKSSAGPGTPSPDHATYVRWQGAVAYDWHGTYNSAPPVCPAQPEWQCARYRNSWFPNATAGGGRVFPYAECGDFQAAARTNHSHDAVRTMPSGFLLWIALAGDFEAC